MPRPNWIAGLVLRISALGLGCALLPLAAEAESTELERDARLASNQLLQQVAGELMREYALSGTLRSLEACKYTATELSSSISKRFGAQVHRVSLRVRNPALGTPDAWEQQQLKAFERRAAGGEDPAKLEVSAYVEEPAGRYYRFMKAIPVSELCLNCHGPRESLTAAAISQIDAEYPHDRATGYSVGDICGAVSYKILIEEQQR